MLDSGILDVAIGLAFVFLLFSLLVSAASELFAAALKWRSEFLWEGIARLLQDKDARDRLYQHPLIRGLANVDVPAAGAAQAAVDWKQGHHGPSYIPSRTFALALVHMLREPHAAADKAVLRLQRATTRLAADPTQMVAGIGTLIDQLVSESADQPFKDKLTKLKTEIAAHGNAQRAEDAVRAFAATQMEAWITSASVPLQRALRPLLDDAANDVDRFRENIEIWFNGGMDRVSGWYKRHTGNVQLAIAFILSVMLNVDALMITRTLWTEPTLRQSIVNEATDMVQSPPVSLVPPAAETGAPAQGFAVNLSSPVVDSGEDLTGYVTVPVAAADQTVRIDRASARFKLAKVGAEDTQADTIDVVVPAGQTTGSFVIRALDSDEDSRERVTATMASQTAAADFIVSPSADQRFTTVRDQLTTLGLPIGWRMCARGREATEAELPFWCSFAWTDRSWETPNPTLSDYLARGMDVVRFSLFPLVRLDGWMMIVGWMLTAAATSLGAPFWFDTLKRFISVRSSGKAPEERPLAPKEVSQPTEPGQRPREADLLGAIRKS